MEINYKFMFAWFSIFGFTLFAVHENTSLTGAPIVQWDLSMIEEQNARQQADCSAKADGQPCTGGVCSQKVCVSSARLKAKQAAKSQFDAFSRLTPQKSRKR